MLYNTYIREVIMGKNKVYSFSSPRMKDLNADVALKTAPKVGSRSGKKVYEKDGFDPIVEGAVHVWGDSSYVNGEKTSKYIAHDAMLPQGSTLTSEQAGKLTDNAKDFEYGGKFNDFADFYISSEYKAFNEALNKAGGDPSKLSGEYKKRWNEMADSQRQLLSNATLYRFSGGSQLKAMGFDFDNPSSFVGKEIKYDKLVSTAHSVNGESSYFSGRPVLTIFRAPKGTWVNNLSLQNTLEEEVAISPNFNAVVSHAFNVGGQNGKAGYTVVIQDIVKSNKLKKVK